MPVMIIGAITVLIFLGIVVMSQKRPPTGPGLTEVSKEGLISDHTYTMGNPNALVTLVEFSDFECPFCKAIHPIVNNLAQLYPNQLKIAYRHFPLPQHKLATKAAEGAQIAGGMGKFWEYVDILFGGKIGPKRGDGVTARPYADFGVGLYRTGRKNAFVGAVGGGVDIDIGGSTSWRIQFDTIIAGQTSFRFTTGFLFRL